MATKINYCAKKFKNLCRKYLPTQTRASLQSARPTRLDHNRPQLRARGVLSEHLTGILTRSRHVPSRDARSRRFPTSERAAKSRATFRKAARTVDIDIAGHDLHARTRRRHARCDSATQLCSTPTTYLHVQAASFRSNRPPHRTAHRGALRQRFPRPRPTRNSRRRTGASLLLQRRPRRWRRKVPRDLHHRRENGQRSICPRCGRSNHAHHRRWNRVHAQVRPVPRCLW